MELYGFNPNEIKELYDMELTPADPKTITIAYVRGLIDQGEARKQLTRIGLEENAIDLLLGTLRNYLSPNNYLRYRWRNIIGDGRLRESLKAQGLTEDDIDAFIEGERGIPGAGDLIRFAVREAYDQGIVRKYGYDENFPEIFAADMAKQGIDREWAERYWYSHWVLPSPTAGYEMLHRGVLDVDGLDDLLRAADYPEFWRERLKAISYSPYTRVDVRRMHALGVLDDEGVKRAYMDIGFDDAKAETMLQFTKVYNQGTTIGAENQFKNEIENLTVRSYQLGHMTGSEARAKLVGAGYTESMADEVISLADWDRTLDIMPDVVNEASRDMKNIVTRAYALRVVDRSFAREVLTGLGVPDTHANALLDAGDLASAVSTAEEVIDAVRDLYTSQSIDRVKATGILSSFGISGQGQEELIDKWNVTLQNRSRRIPRTVWRDLYYDTVISLEEYLDGLRQIGYAEKDVELLAKYELMKLGSV